MRQRRQTELDNDPLSARRLSSNDRNNPENLKNIQNASMARHSMALSFRVLRTFDIATGVRAHSKTVQKELALIHDYSVRSLVSGTERASAILAITSRLGLRFPRSMPPM
jgi:hypothetical protein